MNKLQTELKRLRSCRVPYTTPHRWLQLIEALGLAIEALKLECGNQCAHQNPCNAKETLDSMSILICGSVE